jgi:hypothetical protein
LQFLQVCRENQPDTYQIRFSRYKTLKLAIMKIAAARIEKGMKIKVAGYSDNTEYWNRIINNASSFYSDREKDIYRKLLDDGLEYFINLGTIKKNSPVLVVNSVKFASNWSYISNGRRVTFNNIILDTDKGKMMIGTRQKVELLS